MAIQPKRHRKADKAERKRNRPKFDNGAMRTTTKPQPAKLQDAVFRLIDKGAISTTMPKGGSKRPRKLGPVAGGRKRKK